MSGNPTNQALEVNLGNLEVNEDSLLCAGVDYSSTENIAIHREAPAFRKVDELVFRIIFQLNAHFCH
jgi:hypothetical protein